MWNEEFFSLFLCTNLLTSCFVTFQINDIQKRFLLEKYESIVLKAIYHNSTIIVNPDQPNQNLFERIPITHSDISNVTVDLTTNKHDLVDNEIITNCDQTFAEFDNNQVLQNDVEQPSSTQISSGQLIPRTDIFENSELELKDKTISSSDQQETQIYFSLVNPKDMNLSNYIIKIEPSLLNKTGNMIPSSDQSSLPQSSLPTAYIANEIPTQTDDDGITDTSQYSTDNDCNAGIDSTLLKIRRGRQRKEDSKIELPTRSSKRKLPTKKDKTKLDSPSIAATGGGGSDSAIEMTDNRDGDSNINGADNGVGLHDSDAGNRIDDEYYEEGEGESENEFPARDSDNEDWPAQETLDKFPANIIENGVLTVKGKKLKSLISK